MDSFVGLQVTGPDGEDHNDRETFPRVHSSLLFSSPSVLTVPVDSSRTRGSLPLTDPNFLSADYPYHGRRPSRPKSPVTPKRCLTPNQPRRSSNGRRPSASSCDLSFSCHSSTLSFSSLSYQNAVLNNSAYNSQTSISSCVDPPNGHDPEPFLDPLSRRLSWEISTSDYCSAKFRDCDTYSNILTPIPRHAPTWMQDERTESVPPKVFY